MKDRTIELVAILDTLTTPDSEDWHIILADKTVHIMAVQEDPTPMGRKRVSMGLFEIPITIFKKMVRLSDKGPSRSAVSPSFFAKTI